MLLAKEGRVLGGSKSPPNRRRVSGFACSQLSPTPALVLLEILFFRPRNNGAVFQSVQSASGLSRVLGGS